MSIYQRTSVDAALHVLRDINRKMTVTQNHITTGLRVEKSSDNAVYWSVATTARSDNKALSAVQDALGMAAATMGTASAGVESVVDVHGTRGVSGGIHSNRHASEWRSFSSLSGVALRR